MGEGGGMILYRRNKLRLYDVGEGDGMSLWRRNKLRLYDVEAE